MEAKTRTVNRMQKVLEDANIKLAPVASDILGLSGRAISMTITEIAITGENKGGLPVCRDQSFDSC